MIQKRLADYSFRENHWRIRWGGRLGDVGKSADRRNPAMANKQTLETQVLKFYCISIWLDTDSLVCPSAFRSDPIQSINQSIIGSTLALIFHLRKSWDARLPPRNGVTASDSNQNGARWLQLLYSPLIYRGHSVGWLIGREGGKGKRQSEIRNVEQLNKTLKGK